jgi:hypothetical protein
MWKAKEKLMNKPFIASATENKTLGASIRPVFDAMGDEVRDVVIDHHLASLDPKTWYPQQEYLDVFNDIYERDFNVMHNMVAIGMRVLESATFPPGVNTLEEALGSLDAYYHLNNKDKTGGWDVTIKGKQATCVSTTPFPADFEYGLIYALVRRFLPKKHTFTVTYDGSDLIHKGIDAPCTYQVVWKFN